MVNTAPAKLLRVHGTIDPTLSVRVITRYMSTAEKCRRGTSLIAGASAPLSTSVESAVQRSGGNYEATVTIDHFLDDACRWYPFVIGFQLANEAGASTGEFSTGADGTVLVPGPESKVWISRPGEGLASSGGSRREGASFMRPLELQCRTQSLRGAHALTCVPASPRELPHVSGDAVEVQVDFKDLSQPPAPPAPAP